MSSDPSQSQLRLQCASALDVAAKRSSSLSAFIGLDGFVDEIVHLVSVRHSADQFDRIRTIREFSQRVAEAAGRSTNIEPVTQQVKLGGNGPIMANALASLGLSVTYAGALGWPHRHPVFDPLAAQAEVHSIADPGRTTAMEFEDGKVMLTNSSSLGEINWTNLKERLGADLLRKHLETADLIGFVNWTMVPHMSALWSAIQAELPAQRHANRQKLFVDLADPQKRKKEDIVSALVLVTKFQQWFDVTLGLNEKEALEIGRALGIPSLNGSRDRLEGVAAEIAHRVPVSSVVVHPVRWALAVTAGRVTTVDGPFIASPKITTGAGDHFNAGFCFGKLLGLDDAQSLLCGVCSSGHYVRTTHSPSPADVSALLRRWPQ